MRKYFRCYETNGLNYGSHTRYFLGKNHDTPCEDTQIHDIEGRARLGH